MKASSDVPVEPANTSESPSSRLQGLAYWCAMGLGSLGLLMAINQTFNLKILGFQPLGNAYLYYLIGVFLAAAFLCFPAWSGARHRVPWYDWPLALAALGSCSYLGYHGLIMIQLGWDYMAPTEATAASAVLLVLVLSLIHI